jgi:hypothetical protein
MTEGFYNKIDRVMLVALKSGLPAMRQAEPPKQPILDAERRAPIARTLSGRLAAAEERANAAEQGLLEAQAMLREVHASTSWRITRPLRRLGMLLRQEPRRA